MTETAFTGVLKEIADVAGDVAATLVAAARGGTLVYIPARVGDRHWLVETVGRAAAEKICAHFAVDKKRGARIEIPLVMNSGYNLLRRTTFKRLHDLDLQKKSAREQAQLCGVTERTVRNHRRRHRGDGRNGGGQQSLF